MAELAVRLALVTALVSPFVAIGATAQAAPAAPASATEAAPSAPAAGDPPEAVQAQYREVVARAVTEFDAGRWAEARSLFLQAHTLWPSARTFRTLGMTSFELRSYARALDELQSALDDPRRPLPEDQRQQVAQLIEQTRAFVGRYRVRLAPPNAELLVDGSPRALRPDGVLLLEVGSHDLLARAPGHAELRRRLEVQGREDEMLSLELSPVTQPALAQALPAPVPAAAPASAAPPDARLAETPAHRARFWTWIAGGSAIALGAASTVLWLVSDSKYDAKLQACKKSMTCTKDNTDTSAISTTQTLHQVTAGVAIAAGAAAVALFFIEGASTEKAPSVAFGPGALLLHGKF